jgi:hypothetical protein
MKTLRKMLPAGGRRFFFLSALSAAIKPPERIGFADGQGHDHPSVDVAACLTRLLLVKRYGHEGSQDEAADPLPTAPEQRAVTAGHSGQQHIVDRGAVGVRDLLGEIEIAADDRQPPIRADPTVEAGLRSATLAEKLTQRRPPLLHAPNRIDRLGEGRERVAGPLEPPAHVVRQQGPPGRHRCGGPRWCGRLSRFRHGVRERAEHCDAGNSVRDGVVQSHKEPDPSLRQTGQEPHLPKGPRPLQRAPPELFAGKQQLCVASWRRYREDRDVFGDVEGWSVYPQGPAEPDPRPVQELTEAGNEMQPPPGVLADGLDREATIRVNQTPAVQDGQRTDVLWPPHGFGPDEHQVRRPQAFDQVRLTPNRHSEVPSPPSHARSPALTPRLAQPSATALVES